MKGLVMTDTVKRLLNGTAGMAMTVNGKLVTPEKRLKRLLKQNPELKKYVHKSTK